jgi:hypothetical protein
MTIPSNILNRLISRNAFLHFDKQATPEALAHLNSCLESAVSEIFGKRGLRGFQSRRSDAARHEIGHAVVACHDGREIKSIEIFGDTIEDIEMWGGWIEVEAEPSKQKAPDHDTILKRVCHIYAGFCAEHYIANPDGTPAAGSSIDEIITAQIITSNLSQGPDFNDFESEWILNACGHRDLEIMLSNADVIEELLTELDKTQKLEGARLKEIMEGIHRAPELLAPGLGIKKYLSVAKLSRKHNLTDDEQERLLQALKNSNLNPHEIVRMGRIQIDVILEQYEASLQRQNGDGQAKPAARPSRQTTLESKLASQYKMRGIKWVWKNRFAVGKIGFIGGLPDEGKGLITVYIIAQITTEGK